MLTKTFETVLLLTPWVTALAGGLLLARRLLRGQPAAGALRLAWLALALRCAAPVRLTLPAAPAPAAPAWHPPVLALPRGVSAAAVLAAEPAARSASAAASAAFSLPAVPWSRLLCLAWLAGALVFCGAQLARHLAFLARLRRDRVRLALPGRVWLSPAAEVPVAVGLVRPAVYLPAQTAPVDLPYVLAHEKRHIRAGDLWFQLLLLAAQSLYWFDPVIHRMARAAREDMELACDAAVLRGRPLADRLRYGEAVLAALKKARRQAALSAPLCGPGRAVQTRFKEMLDMRTPKKRFLLLPALACAAALAASLFTACAAPAAGSALSQPDPGVFSTGDLSALEEPASAPEESASVGCVWPVPDSYRISRGYGKGQHEGLDILGDYETPIYAIQDGEVIAAGQSKDTEDMAAHWAYGIHVTLDHGDGLQSAYAQLASVAVEEGDTVEKGQLIGYMGSTGRSTGTHLHLMTSQDGALFNPYELFHDVSLSTSEEPDVGSAADSSAVS